MRACLLLCALLGAGPAGAASLKAEYRITLAGLTLGSADLTGRFTGDRYDLSMTAQLTGIAGLFTASGRGGATATGSLGPVRPVSQGFSASTRASGAERKVQVEIENGNAGDVLIAPPFEPRPDRVPLREADRRGIVDPLSGILGVVATRGRPDDPANCDRTIPVFDGTQRFNVVLSYAETKPVAKPGYAGPVLVCNARYVPVTGHRPSRWAVQYMQDNREMSVWLAPVEGARALVPIRIAIMTYYGLGVVEAERWRVD